jgi:hypothetical protein
MGSGHYSVVWIKRNSSTYQITSSGAVKKTPRDEAQRAMARCGVRFSTGSTTRRKTNGSAVHHLVLCIIGQWTHSLGNVPGFDLLPTVWCSVDWQSARKAPVQLISLPAHQYMVILSALLNTTHICCTTVVTILTTCFHIQKSCILPESVCVCACACACVCVCVFCMILGINRNNEYFPKQHNSISLFNGNSLFSVRYEIECSVVRYSPGFTTLTSGRAGETWEPNIVTLSPSLSQSLVSPSSQSYVTGSI